MLEVFLVIANIGVAVVMFPILRRKSEPLALGCVASRIVEGAMICVGIISLLPVASFATPVSDVRMSVGTVRHQRRSCRRARPPLGWPTLSVDRNESHGEC